MRVVGKFNDVSETVKKRISPLKRGETATYRLLDGRTDVVDGEVKFGSMDEIVCRDLIYDDEKGQPVEIGVPGKIVDGEVKRAKKIQFQPGKFMVDVDQFTLVGGNIEHGEFYEFLEISNINKSNPHRDETVTAKVERVDAVAEAAVEESFVDTLTKALTEVATLNAAAIRSFAAGRNWNLSVKPEVLRAQVKKYAAEFPADFLAALDDKDGSLKSTLKQALDAGIIQYVPHENKIAWADGTTVAKLDKPQEGESEIELFSAWLKTTKNGDNIVKSIQNKVKNLSK